MPYHYVQNKPLHQSKIKQFNTTFEKKEALQFILRAFLWVTNAVYHLIYTGSQNRIKDV